MSEKTPHEQTPSTPGSQEANPSKATEKKRPGWVKKTAAGVAGALAIGGAIETTHPKPVGEGTRIVQAGSEDEALGEVPGAYDIPREAARKFVEETDADGNYIVPDKVTTKRNLNPFDNQVEWRQDSEEDDS